jgi:MinD-like ATPase involved in chromosome partitioning or flagellar assembly
MCSGRDGVGKSSICINLAIALARSGKRTGILDTDASVSGIHRLLGITPRYSLANAVAGICSLRHAINQGPGNIQLLLDDNHSRAFDQQPRLQQQLLLQQLQEWEQSLDYILIDTTAARNEQTDNLTDIADELLLVLVPQPATLSDSFALLSHMDSGSRQKAKHLIVNRVSSAAQARAAHHKFSSTVKKFIDDNVLYCGAIALDDNIRNAFALQYPVALYDVQNASCAQFFKLAQSLEAQLSPLDPTRKGWSQNLASRISQADDPERRQVAIVPSQKAALSTRISDKQLFMRTPTLADELIDRGQLDGFELRTVVDQLTTTGRHEFPLDFSARADAIDTKANHASRYRFQQSLLSLLKQNRSTDKSLDQLLNDFLEQEH